MKYLIYRNHTVEHLFKSLDASFSGYGDIMHPSDAADKLIWFYYPSIKSDNEELAAEIADYSNKLQFVIERAGSKPIIVFLLNDQLCQQWFDNDLAVQKSIQHFNDEVITLAKNNSNVQFIDFGDFARNYGKNEMIDWKFYYISQMIISPKLAKPFQSWFDLKLKSLSYKRKKCLVLDLDNTLWGGILGEDGMEGIKIGDTYPGKAFKDFQELLIQAGKNGIILTVCSKNNLTDVEEAWEKHPSIILKKEHLSAYRINWNNKALNIQEIAEELNIGLDSMVFIDDNPAERAIVKDTIPEICVPEFPEHPHQLVHFFKELLREYFQIYDLTAEDKQKTTQYIQNAQRQETQKKFVDVDTYLASLEMELEIKGADEMTIGRIAQMTQKTNQFNLTTQRYEVSDIQNFLNRGALVYCLGVKDKFGDNGTTVATIINIDEDQAEIDSFLLSCRILGRGIEKAFLKHMLNRLLEKGIEQVIAKYIPTRKNKQTESFYDQFGFEVIEVLENGSKIYQLTLSKKMEMKDYYKFKEAIAST